MSRNFAKIVFWFFATMVIAATAFAYGQEPQLPEGEGKKILETKCTVCHDLGPVTESHRSKEDWTDLVKVMVASGAEVTDAEAATLVDYLVKNWGPDSPPAQ